jgi:hypothetical protein
LENQAIIRAHHRRRSGRAQGAEARQAKLFESAFGFPGRPRRLNLKHSPRGRGSQSLRLGDPAISSARHVCDIVHGPAFIAPLRAGSGGPGRAAVGSLHLMHEPALQPKYPIYRFAIYPEPLTKAQ